MSSSVLNPNQARHLTSVLGLLLEDLADLSATLPHDAGGDQIRQAIQRARVAVEEVLERLGLSPPRAPDARQRLLAYVSVWLSRLHEVKSAGLKGYGTVSLDLRATLDPGIEHIRSSLEDLSALLTGGRVS